MAFSLVIVTLFILEHIATDADSSPYVRNMGNHITSLLMQNLPHSQRLVLRPIRLSLITAAYLQQAIGKQAVTQGILAALANKFTGLPRELLVIILGFVFNPSRST